jgi:hypothetical protein
MNTNVAFIPAKRLGVVALCSCDPTDANMGNFGFVLLHLTGPYVYDLVENYIRYLHLEALY